jgi:hypothetical protein
MHSRVNLKVDHRRHAAVTKKPAKTPNVLKSPSPISALQADEHAKHMAWVNWLSELKGEDFSNLAVKAGRSSNTLTRMRQSQSATLDALTVRMLCDFWKVPGPETYLLPGTAGFAAEGDLFDAASHPALAALVECALSVNPGSKAFVLNTRALEKSGYDVGDIVLVATSQRARAGDAVVAEHTDASQSAKPQLRFRLFEPPFLRGDSSDPSLKKFIHVDDHITIIGPIVAQIRTRR